jgi:arylsulfatase A-like enzyme
LPTFVAAAGNPNITEELLKGKQIGDRTYKNHFDGYNQMDMPSPAKGRRLATRFSTSRESTVGAVRIDDYQVPLHRPARLAGSGDQTPIPDVPVTLLTCAWIRSSAQLYGPKAMAKDLAR